MNLKKIIAGIARSMSLRSWLADVIASPPQRTKQSTFVHGPRAETLLEVLIAVSILSFMVMLAGQVQIAAVRQNQITKQELVAVQLADEAMEVLRGILVTNAIRFPSRIDRCWYTRPEHTDIATCDAPLNLITGGSYALVRDLSNFTWRLVSRSLNQGDLQAQIANLELMEQQGLLAGRFCDSVSAEHYRVRLDSPLAPGEPVFFRGCREGNGPANPAYTSIYFQPDRQNFAPSFYRGISTPYFRSVDLSLDDLNADANADGLTLVVRVQYKFAGKWYVTSRTTFIGKYEFLKR